ncbi:hypothetical protein A1A1_17600 [Planococcus antarcticus DSM 14505]|uniref:Uncharacterized protein n=1 Tax=Planococcus antarcticus DSM 14505 TaxID=1185653 RepID=A0AA87LPZ2_9BACL|nr:hypothetical protein A1A1_17600 [Planococcus antarcticus DSM 14505]
MRSYPEKLTFQAKIKFGKLIKEWLFPAQKEQMQELLHLLFFSLCMVQMLLYQLLILFDRLTISRTFY